MQDKSRDLFRLAPDPIYDTAVDRAGDLTLADNPWQLIIADDEPEIHALTRLVLDGYVFDGRRLIFHSAYTGAEALKQVEVHPGAAIILLDVVMESEHAGLAVARAIREQLHNPFIRIILRTGYPGQAPEQEVVSNYDINDYKCKTELTAQKLYTSVTSALRSYRDICRISRSYRALEQVVGVVSNLFVRSPMNQFADRLLDQFQSLKEINLLAPMNEPSSLVAILQDGDFRIIAGRGRLRDCLGKSAAACLPGLGFDGKLETLACPFLSFGEKSFLGVFRTSGGHLNLVYHDDLLLKTEQDRNIVRVFANSMDMAFDNQFLDRDRIETQYEVIHTLGEVVENRSRETAHHTLRVGSSSGLLARLAGLPAAEVGLLEMAAPMHDVGKVCIPDNILHKAGPLSVDERKVMEGHTRIGRDIFRRSNRELWTVSSTIAEQHHERWDGRGYPQGLTGREIHIHARIVGLVDVFDALINDRVYRRRLALEKVLEIIRAERGRHFDPGLVDLFLENIDAFLEIQKRYSDPVPSSTATGLAARVANSRDIERVNPPGRPTDPSGRDL